MKSLIEDNSLRQLPAFWRHAMLRKYAMSLVTTLGVALAVCLPGPAIVEAGGATVPPVVVSGVSTITRKNVTNPGKVVQDSCGNYYELEAGGALMEIPAKGGDAIQIVNDGSWWSGDGLLGGLAIDSKNNLYVGKKWSGAVAKIPSTNCVPDASAATTVAGSSLGQVSVYWYDPGDIAVDAAGDVFVHTEFASGLIYEETAAGTGVLVLGADSSISHITSLAVDASGNVFFTASGDGKVYEVPKGSFGTSSPTVVVSSGITTAMGVAFDKLGNMFIGDSGAGAIYEVPNNGSLDYGSMFLVASGVTITSPITLSNDGTAVLYTDSFGTANVYRLSPGGADLGSVAAGSSSNSTIRVAFNSSESATFSTRNSAYSVTGGTCADGSFNAGDSCRATVTLKPATPGVNAGAFVVADGGGGTLAVANLSGIGAGAGLTIDPGVIASLGSGYTDPKGVAADASGDIYIADSGANAVWEIAAGSTTPVSLGSGLSTPKGVAVDGAGNIYVADTGNSRVIEIPVVNGAPDTSSQTTVIASSATLAGTTLNAPGAVAIDSHGNMYVADTGNKRVVYVPFTGTYNTSLASAVGSGMTSPSALAFNATGDLYVADAGSGNVFKLVMPVTAVTQTTVASGYTKPSSIAVDASGALFVVDNGNQQVLRIPNLSGTLTSTSAVNITGQLDASGNPIIANPYGIALDGKGNVYVSDSTDAAAYTLTRTSSTENAGTWSPNTTSGALSYLLENSGNAALTFGSPYVTATGDTSQFSLLSGEAKACADGGNVAAGGSCAVESEFAPTANGNYTYTLTLSSNAANATGQTLTFTGRGAQTVATTTTISQSSPSGMPTYDEAVSFNVAVSSSQGTPTGSLSLVVDGITKQTATLSNGTAAFTLAGGVLSGGAHSIAAKYIGGESGFTVYSPSNSTELAVTVSTVPTTTKVSFTTMFTQPSSQPANTAITLTASVASAFAGTPTGAVTFTIKDSGGATTTGTGTLAASGSGGFEATYSYTPTAPASGVSYDVVSVTATYQGDDNFAGSSSASSSFDVAGPQGSMVINTGAASLTSTETKSGSVTFTLTSMGGWAGVVGFTCDPKSLPANTACQFVPGQATVFANTATTTYPASTVKMSLLLNHPPLPPTASTMVWWVAGPMGFLLLVVRRRSKAFTKARRWSALLLIVALGAISACIVGVAACGSGATFTTPKGTTAVTVNAYADPYVAGSTSTTVACSSISTYPCSHQTFTVNVTVQ